MASLEGDLLACRRFEVGGGRHVHGAVEEHHYAAHEEETAWGLSVRASGRGWEGGGWGRIPPEQKATPISGRSLARIVYIS